MDKIDFVIPWVDPNDKNWQKERTRYSDKKITSANSEVRYRDWELLPFWFRGVERFAPWVNKIHFVTCGQIPSWLNTKHSKLEVVDHKDFIPPEYLPTFSSHAIELNLHRIKNLSERFVYFNDDIFLTSPVSPDYFFKKGKPCDIAALNCIYFGKDSAGSFCGADITLINSNFSKKHAIKSHPEIWFSPKNGIRNIIKTALLYPWPWFPGIYYQHGANSFLKSTFITVWKREYDTLNETCISKFRKNGDTNQWIMKFWQIADGNIAPRSDRNFRCYHIKDANFEGALNAVIAGRYKLICINDTANTTNFESKREQIKGAFSRLLPEASSFEKG